MKLNFSTTVFVTLLLLCSSAFSQPPEPVGRDPFAGHLFPPELILSNQARLGLSADQRTGIMSEMKAFQTDIVELQWDMQQAMEGLQGAMEASPISEETALERLDRLLSFENRVKRRHIQLLIRIRQQLDDDQIALLQALTSGS